MKDLFDKFNHWKTTLIPIHWKSSSKPNTSPPIILAEEVADAADEEVEDEADDEATEDMPSHHQIKASILHRQRTNSSNLRHHQACTSNCFSTTPFFDPQYYLLIPLMAMGREWYGPKWSPPGASINLWMDFSWIHTFEDGMVINDLAISGILSLMTR